MSATSKFALVAAFVLSSASVALADEHFDVNIYRAAQHSLAFATDTGALGAHARAHVNHGVPSADETRLFAKGSYAGWWAPGEESAACPRTFGRRRRGGSRSPSAVSSPHGYF
jgi:hypothetical protein